MKFLIFRSVAVATGATFLAILTCAAQSTPPVQPPATPTDQQSKGKVIFSRSTDENGKTTTQIAQPPVAPVEKMATDPLADDAQRQAVNYTALDLDVHLHPDAQQIAVRALVTVRNDGPAPLTLIPLQISSSLNWERIRLAGKDLAFTVATLNSDADHTGQLHEAAIVLAEPLAHGESLQFDTTYSGKIAVTAKRLVTVGAPEHAALHADWDQISLAFTGLRGFGNVVWYPVSSAPVILGDGARLFDEIGEQKLRLSGARFRLRLTDEFPHGQAPTIAVVNGHSVPLTVTESSSALDQSEEVNGVASGDSGSTTLGFQAPSLFVAPRTPHDGPNLTAYFTPEDNVSVAFWTDAAGAVKPFIESWLGKQPGSQLTLLDLPDPEDAPFETGSLLAAPLREPAQKGEPVTLKGVLVHALTHAWLASTDSPPRPAWLNEGLATFLGTLWVESQSGREKALGTLEADRAALALAEPPSPAEGPGQPLAKAVSPVYYRTKAAYVLWMLRDLAGDEALATALRSGNLGNPGAFERALEGSGSHPNLSWFFQDWVDEDKGLPDLSIDGVFPVVAADGNWLVAVKIANAGYAAADVPVIVHSGTGSEARFVTQRVRVPARESLTTRVLILGKPTEVQVNDGSVPETQASVHIRKIDEPASTSQPDSR